MPFKAFISHRWESKDRLFARLVFDIFDSHQVEAFLDVERLSVLSKLKSAVQNSELY